MDNTAASASDDQYKNNPTSVYQNYYDVNNQNAASTTTATTGPYSTVSQSSTYYNYDNNSAYYNQQNPYQTPNYQSDAYSNVQSSSAYSGGYVAANNSTYANYTTPNLQNQTYYQDPYACNSLAGTNTTNYASNTGNYAINTANYPGNSANYAGNPGSYATNPGNCAANSISHVTNTLSYATNNAGYATNTSSYSTNTGNYCSYPTNNANYPQNSDNYPTNTNYGNYAISTGYVNNPTNQVHQPATTAVQSSVETPKKPSNVDLLAGLDFTINQMPLTPQVPSTKESEDVSTTTTAAVKPPVQQSKAKEDNKYDTVETVKYQRPKKDPFLNPEIVKAFGVEIEKFEKFVNGLTNKTANGQTTLELKWKFIQDSEEKRAISVARCYPLKNRYPDILPYDYARVELKTTKDDYINATHLKVFIVSVFLNLKQKINNFAVTGHHEHIATVYNNAKSTSVYFRRFLEYGLGTTSRNYRLYHER